MSSELKVDTISEKTTASGVTIDGVLVKDGEIASSYISGLSGGKILQVVEGTHSTTKLISSTSFTDSDLSASITPSATTSKILVIVQHNVSIYRIQNNLTGTIQLLRDSTVIRDGFYRIFINNATTVNPSGTHTIMALDTPSTTSSITYKTQGKIDTTLNSAEIKFQNGDKTDTIILIEVDGS